MVEEMKNGCRIEGTMKFISKKWTLLIIKNLIDNRRMRYTDLTKSLNGISSKTLTDRLRELEELGLIKREMFKEIPPRVEYSLTQKGMEMGESLTPLVEWSEKWEKRQA